MAAPCPPRWSLILRGKTVWLLLETQPYTPPSESRNTKSKNPHPRQIR